MSYIHYSTWTWISNSKLNMWFIIGHGSQIGMVVLELNITYKMESVAYKLASNYKSDIWLILEQVDE